MSLKMFLGEHRLTSVIAVIVVLAIIYALGQNPTSFRLSKSDADYGVTQSSVGSVAYDSLTAEEASIKRGGVTAPSIAPAPGGPGYGSYGSGENIVIDEERIIKNASIDMEVDSVESAIPAIENIVKSVDGIVLSSAASEDTTGTKYGYITVKVPVAIFDQAREHIKEVAVFVMNDQVSAYDVTEEFIDIEAQLINLRAQEDTYRSLLNRASAIEDVLQITNYLTNVRTQIEQIEGRKRYLEGQTDYSTINVSLTEDKDVTVPSREWRPITVIKDAARNTIRQFQGFVDNSIGFLFWTVGIIPYLLLIACIYWIITRFRKS